jgi:hypothetical protein
MFQVTGFIQRGLVESHKTNTVTELSWNIEETKGPTRKRKLRTDNQQTNEATASSSRTENMHKPGATRRRKKLARRNKRNNDNKPAVSATSSNRAMPSRQRKSTEAD